MLRIALRVRGYVPEDKKRIEVYISEDEMC